MTFLVQKANMSLISFIEIDVAISLFSWIRIKIISSVFGSGIRPWDQINLVLSTIEISKTCFFLYSLMCIFPESSETKFWSHSFYIQNSGILQTRMDLRRNPIKTNFDNFQMQKWISQTIRAQKVDEKVGSFV